MSYCRGLLLKGVSYCRGLLLKGVSYCRGLLLKGVSYCRGLLLKGVSYWLIVGVSYNIHSMKQSCSPCKKKIST